MSKVITTALSLLLLLVALCCAGCVHTARSGSATTQPIDEDDLVRQLKASISDADHLDSMIQGAGSHAGGFLPLDFWKGMFPYTYAGERIVSRGRVVVDPLRRVADDPRRSPKVRDAASRLLGCFEPKAYLLRMIQNVRNKRMTPNDFYWEVKRVLPIPDEWAGLPEERLPELIAEKLAQQGYESLILEGMDGVMQSRDVSNMIQPADERLIRWFNRINGDDLDDFLARTAPEGLVFRNEQLAKGYDPLDAFENFPNLMFYGEFSRAVDSVYSSQRDRNGCRQLFEAIYGYMLRHESPPGEPDGSEWYFAHRAEWRYDAERRRFVVASHKGASRSG